MMGDSAGGSSCSRYCDLCQSKPSSAPCSTRRQSGRDSRDSAGGAERDGRRGGGREQALSVLPGQAGSVLVRAANLCNTSSNRLSERHSVQEEVIERLDSWKKATVWKSWQRYLGARWSAVSCHDWKCGCKAPFTVQVKPSYRKYDLSRAAMTQHKHSSQNTPSSSERMSTTRQNSMREGLITVRGLTGALHSGGKRVRVPSAVK